MANYTISENPQYTTEIRKLQNTDPANAEAILNPLIETLIGNTHAVKQKADSIEVLQERMDSQQAELSGKADNEHLHDAGDISSGILPIARGGTGGSTGATACTNLGALSKSGGTMTGILYAQSNTSYTTAQVRNISASTSDLTAGTSSLANGNPYLVYE